MIDNTKVYQIQEIQEVILIAPLIRKFFENTKTKYTEKDLYMKIPEILRDGAIFFAEEDGIIRGYIIGWKINSMEGLCAFILQTYSERAFMLRRLKEAGDKWCRENNISRQIMLVDPDKENFFKMHYQMEREGILMTREIKLEIKEELLEKQEAV